MSVSDITVRSYLEDVPTTYHSDFHLRDVALPPPGGAPNRLVYLSVDGNPQGVAEEFGQTVTRSLTCLIGKNASCQVSREAEYWLIADTEPNIHKPKRYTQHLELHLENLTSASQNLQLKVKSRGNDWVTETLPYGKKRLIVEMRDIKPGEEAYDFRILKP